MKRTIKEFMTQPVRTIGATQTLTAAHKLMSELDIRHLPVLREGAIVGLVSQRDLHLLGTLRDVDPARVTVEEAMSQDTLTVSPETSLATVARQMARRKAGSAVVMRGPNVAGIFTTVDALRALDTLLHEAPPKRTAAAKRTVPKRARARRS